MKKAISILLAVLMLFALACAASADEVPQPEGGKKFENDWAIAGGLVRVDYEEEGYRVAIDIVKNDKGSVWQYSCLYQEGTDSLVSISSSRADYIVDPNTGDRVFGDDLYEGLDDADKTTSFTIDGDGFLLWKDGHDNAGEGLRFANIGKFDGVWKNEEEETEAEFLWNGMAEDELFYTVYIIRGKTDGERYASYLMNGTYDPATGKLSASGTCAVFTKNADGDYVSEEDGETYDAFFSMPGNGRLLYETANGIELDYDIMGHPQG